MRKLFEEKKWSVVRLGEIIEFKSLGEYHPSSLNLATTSFKELSKKNEVSI